MPKTASAQFGVEVGYGFNTTMNAYLLSLKIPSCFRYYDEYIWPVRGYWEGSALMINALKGNPLANQLYGGALAYLLRFEKECFCFPLLDPYAEIGLGVGYFNKKEIVERKLGSNGLIEGKVGLGLRFGPLREYEIGYKFIHFSNGYMARPNDAINLHFVAINFWFQ